MIFYRGWSVVRRILEESTVEVVDSNDDGVVSGGSGGDWSTALTWRETGLKDFNFYMFRECDCEFESWK